MGGLPKPAPGGGARPASPKALAILGSAPGDTHSASLVRRLTAGLACDLVDLGTISIAPFSPAQNYSPDSFLDVVAKMAAAPVTIFATPVYWYSYSAVMKGFIDRFTDLQLTHKQLGGSLRRREFALLASGSETELEPALNIAFSRFCDSIGARCIALVYAQGDGPFVDPDAVALVRRAMGEA
jgi:hypothetical protein